MKETKIAKENVENWEKLKVNIDNELIDNLSGEIQGHKQTCQRWLEFLEEEKKYMKEYSWQYTDKITDLKQVIKTYDEAGI